MSAKLYPFIDIAVHEQVRGHFARGEAAVLFSQDMGQVLWSNGEGAALFGTPSIYDFIDSGTNTADVAFRQMEATARQLARVGDSRSFLMRIGTGFRRMPVSALVKMISVHPGETAILFTAPGNVKARTPAEIARTMISGFDDPDTHMAVLDGDGGIIAASAGFESLAMTPQTCRALVAAVARDSDWLVKRPIPTGKGHLPAAIGKLSDTPALHLLFAVETILGNLDPGADFDDGALAGTSTAAALDPPAAILADAEPASDKAEPVDGAGFQTETPLPDDGAASAAGPASIDPASSEPNNHADPDPEHGVVADETPSDAFVSEAEALPGASAPETTPSQADAGAFIGNAVDESPLDNGGDAAPAPEQLDLADGVTDVDIETSGEADQPEADAIVQTLEPDLEAVNDPLDPSRDDDAAIAGEAATGIDANHTAPVEAISGTPVENTAAIADESDEETSVAPATSDEATDEFSGEFSGKFPGEIDGERPGEPADALPTPAEIDAGTPTSESDEASFLFNPDSRAVRFVWKIDSGGRFREISDEFSRAVGPASADISGVTFSEIAERYNLDVDGKIGELLKRRDTWSGKTILWPVEGTSLQVPVDLAALPTYSRNREFDGFRGFGIVRVADAIEDPRSIGLALGLPVADALDRHDGDEADGTALPVTEALAPIAENEAAVDATLSSEADQGAVEATDDRPDDAVVAEDGLTVEAEGDDAAAETEALSTEPGDDDQPTGEIDAPKAADETPEDPFRGERPALQIVENPGHSPSDKVVRLDNHRPQGAETLTRGEQAAFREIARQLGETFGKREGGPPPVATDEQAETPETVAQTQTPEQERDDTAGLSSAETPHAAEAEQDIDPRGDAASGADIEDDAPKAVVDVLPTRSSAHAGSVNQDLLDSLPVALLVHAGDELYHANPEFLALTGFASLEALREEGGIDALFVAEEDGLFDMPDGTMMLIRNDGRLVPVNARLQSIRWEEKSALVMALSAAPQDARATESVETEVEAAPVAVNPDHAAIAALQMEAEELRSILETATDGVAIIGADGEIRSLNRSANALFNYDDGEIRGKPFAMLFAHESQKAVLDYLAGLAGHGVASVLNDGREVIGREASGGFIPLFMTMGRLSSSNGYCAVIRDITQWKRTEEELRNAKRAAETANAHKSDFLARVSHEIRTPLNAIIGFSDMMASEHFGAIGNPRYVEYANDIGRSGRHVLDIVNDLLDISKIEAGEMDLEFTAVEINDAVSEAVSLVQPQANSQRVIIRTSLSGSVPNIVADSRSIKQMALNILSNAIRFTPSGGQIVVSTAYEANGSVILRVRDTGIGMTRTELEQAMKPFRQVTTGARKRGDGTGLGLPLTKAMAEANRAQFSINSAPNEGTLVEISFPSQRVLAD
ncbi:ATP-binding protein [Pararhizobium antarcticum]|uniref:histidine kinase n=1 Tax=Pararhizobium antarcticum TaxID=1798805 RepID=A0A657LVX0_9HYPH|nr:ATP-binding protein [Pararhizobium antarcticum]OJF99041.1 PAS domain-containing sensor histidine kinase [Pararhizobium antarcticum]